MSIFNLINPIDKEALREKVRKSEPVPNFCIDNFLKTDFAEKVAGSFPTFDDALKVGKTHVAVNDRGKVQVTDARLFPPAIATLNELLADQELLDLLSYVMDIPRLLADEQLVGGGIHQTGPRGHLDVHVDFNVLAERNWHRRLNVLIYFNKNWQADWGGEFELWDKDVKVRHHCFLPAFNRCVVFETNEVSFHGVNAVKCPAGQSRKSFAGYYYTAEAPAHYTGVNHTTLYRARPDEVLKGSLLMPAEKAKRWLTRSLRETKNKITGG